MADEKSTYLVSGNGDVIEPDDGIVAIGSGGPYALAAARALHPIHEREILGRRIFLFDGADRRTLAALGDVHTPSLADLFVATIGNQAYAAPSQPSQPAAQPNSAPNSDQGVAQ